MVLIFETVFHCTVGATKINPLPQTGFEASIYEEIGV
jgi:hypothetical protein